MNFSWNSYVDASCFSHTGKVRKNNEDSFLCMKDFGLFAVSDGMGGGNAGEIASQMIVSHLKSSMETASDIPGEREGDIIRAANQANFLINDFALEHHYSSMGATLVTMLLNPWHPELATVFHAGDSRLYRIRNNHLECLTEDHTVAAVSKVSENKLAPMFRGVLTNALGTGVDFFLERTCIDIQKDDFYILCSDGLSRMVNDQEIQQICIPFTNGSCEVMCTALINAALANGGRDNVTVVVIRIRKLWEEHSPSRDEADKEAGAQIRNLMDLSETPKTEVKNATVPEDN